MQANRSNVGALIAGTVLILFGLLALAGQVFRLVNWGLIWPFAVIGVGALFFVAMFAGGKQSAGLAVPGSIVGGIGLILLFQNLTGHWESMSYFWALIILFVGVGIYLMGLYGENPTQKASGWRLMKVGAILFIVFGTFFEMLFSSFNNLVFPVLLILLGVYLVFTRSGLLGSPKKTEELPKDDSIPPAS